VRGHAHLLRLHDPHEAGQDLGVGEAGEAHDGAAALDGLDDLGGQVAGEGEARGVGVDLHRAPQRLLGSGCHAGGKEHISEDQRVLVRGAE
jgi:hypothetical protein